MHNQNPHKLAVITGASKGLGKALAFELAYQGYDLALGARSLSELELIRDELNKNGRNILIHPLDVASPDSIRSFHAYVHENAGAADVLINNAGLGYMKSLAKITAQEITTTFNVNVIGTLLTTQAFLEDIKQTKGHILNIASDVGRRPVGGISTYVAAKHAIVGFSHSLLRELKNDGVRVTAVLPGAIQSNFNETTSPGAPPDPKAMNAADAAKTIAGILSAPPGIVMDEIQFRPLTQDL